MNIYNYLPPGVLNELKRKTPKNKNGNRSTRFHQFLTEDTGLPTLDHQLQKTNAYFRRLGQHGAEYGGKPWNYYGFDY